MFIPVVDTVIHCQVTYQWRDLALAVGKSVGRYLHKPAYSGTYSPVKKCLTLALYRTACIQEWLIEWGLKGWATLAQLGTTLKGWKKLSLGVPCSFMSPPAQSCFLSLFHKGLIPKSTLIKGGTLSSQLLLPRDSNCNLTLSEGNYSQFPCFNWFSVTDLHTYSEEQLHHATLCCGKK